MFKLIVLILGLAVGFGGGVYWAHKNPEDAAKFSAEEERRFLEAQLAITEKIKAKLDELVRRCGRVHRQRVSPSSQSKRPRRRRNREVDAQQKERAAQRSKREEVTRG